RHHHSRHQRPPHVPDLVPDDRAAQEGKAGSAARDHGSHRPERFFSWYGEIEDRRGQQDSGLSKRHPLGHRWLQLEFLNVQETPPRPTVRRSKLPAMNGKSRCPAKLVFPPFEAHHRSVKPDIVCEHDRPEGYHSNRDHHPNRVSNRRPEGQRSCYSAHIWI